MICDGKNAGEYKGYCSQQCKKMVTLKITEDDIKEVYPCGRPTVDWGNKMEKSNTNIKNHPDCKHFFITYLKSGNCRGTVLDCISVQKLGNCRNKLYQNKEMHSWNILE